VEASEKLRFPVFGLVTGFVSASTGSGKAPPYRERKCLVFLVKRKTCIDGSFIGEAACVKNWFELAGGLSNDRGSGFMKRMSDQVKFLRSVNIGFCACGALAGRQAEFGCGEVAGSGEIDSSRDDVVARTCGTADARSTLSL
jgi:hypothetical protein